MEEGSRMMREMMKGLGMKKSVGVDGDPRPTPTATGTANAACASRKPTGGSPR
jgi:hypothetical protein